jgi:hypothetical protein
MNMRDNNNLQRTIEHALRNCSDDEVKRHLKKALFSIEKKSKESKKRKETQTPLEQWRLNLSAGSMINMNRYQRNIAIKKIDEMIADEGKKIRQTNSDEFLLD